MSQFFVYVDYTQEDVARPFYVGKGTQKRVQKRNRSPLHDRFVAKYGMERRVVFETNDEEAAFVRERELIQELRTFTHGGEGWWGANLTLGGEGPSGAVLPKSAETRERIRAGLMGHAVSDEARQKMSEAQRRRGPHKPETKAKISAGCKGRVPSESTRQKLSDSCKRMHERGAFTEETRKKISESARNPSEEKRQRMRESQRRRRERERMEAQAATAEPL